MRIYPNQVTDRDGLVWNWSDVWGGYRAPGHMTHGIDTLRTERGPIVTSDEVWPTAVGSVVEVLIGPSEPIRFTLTDTGWTAGRVTPSGYMRLERVIFDAGMVTIEARPVGR